MQIEIEGLRFFHFAIFSPYQAMKINEKVGEINLTEKVSVS